MSSDSELNSRISRLEYENKELRLREECLSKILNNLAKETTMIFPELEKIDLEIPKLDYTNGDPIIFHRTFKHFLTAKFVDGSRVVVLGIKDDKKDINVDNLDLNNKNTYAHLVNNLGPDTEVYIVEYNKRIKTIQEGTPGKCVKFLMNLFIEFKQSQELYLRVVEEEKKEFFKSLNIAE